MAGQHDDVGLFDKGQDGLGELFRAGHFVGRERDVAEKILSLGMDALRNRLTGNGKRGCVGRVRVDDTIYIGTSP